MSLATPGGEKVRQIRKFPVCIEKLGGTHYVRNSRIYR